MDHGSTIGTTFPVRRGRRHDKSLRSNTRSAHGLKAIGGSTVAFRIRAQQRMAANTGTNVCSNLALPDADAVNNTRCAPNHVTSSGGTNANAIDAVHARPTCFTDMVVMLSGSE